MPKHLAHTMAFLYSAEFLLKGEELISEIMPLGFCLRLFILTREHCNHATGLIPVSHHLFRLNQRHSSYTDHLCSLGGFMKIFRQVLRRS